jgi:hypothetical protein
MEWLGWIGHEFAVIRPVQAEGRRSAIRLVKRWKW